MQHAAAQKTAGFRRAIKETIESVMDSPVFLLRQLKGGKKHSVFKAWTKRGIFVMKVFASKKIYQDRDRPEHHKLLWIDDRLRAQGVPRGELLHFAVEHPVFTSGFFLYRFVPGVMAQSLIESGKLSEGHYLHQLGRTLRRVHDIVLTSYGTIDPERFRYVDYIGQQMRDVGEGLTNMHVKYDLPADILTRAEGVIDRLRVYESRFFPVLIHDDAWPTNCIWQPRVGPTLIDWDEAMSNVWLKDIANLTFTSDVTPEAAERSLRLLKKFMKGYGDNGWSLEDIQATFPAFHLKIALDLWAHHYFHTGREAGMEVAKAKIFSLLKVL